MTKIINYGIFAAIVLGVLFPSQGSFKILIPILLALMLFFSFLKLDLRIRKFLRWELGVYFFIGLLILPFLVFLLTKSLDMELRLGIFLVSITPTAIGAPIIVDMIKGNRELVVSNVVLYNLLSPFTYVVLLSLYFKTNALVIPVFSILEKLVLMIFIPLFLALLFKRIIVLDSSLKKIGRVFSPFAFILVIGIAVSSASSELRNMEMLLLLKVFVIVFLFAVVSFALGFLFSKNEKSRKAMSVVFGHKNSTLAIWIALSNFSPLVVVPMVIYVVCHHIINGILIHRFSD
jgi:bile acid:Na+ symporter, BASS family